MQSISRESNELKKILLIGSNNLAYHYLQMIQTYSNLTVIAVICTDHPNSYFNSQSFAVPIKKSLETVYKESVDYIFVCDHHPELEINMEKFIHKPILFEKSQLEINYPLIESFVHQYQNLELILNNIRDGLIVVDQFEHIQFINKAAKEIVGIGEESVVNLPIRNVIQNTRLPKILQHQEKEVNQKLMLHNKKKIITTRIPLINNKNHLIGAFALFKDSSEVQKLAEENTDLKEIKTMLEAIIHSSDEAISVVDENGNGLIINPAYTRITGLTEKDVIGKPATVDIYEGESMHFHVLKTRRPVRGEKMKVGPHRKEVLVNVAPIIVAGKLKGSVAVIHDISEIKELTTALKQAKQMIRNLEATYTFNDIIGS